ncbi:MarR family winged helix-turn-helix transcriptional regulator [Blautia sp. Sow4_E7]|uniref:MarR family winged helix-turn-helix transcriptional regulator n=1 Tax=Blautia sp. Sow4_E7 TaxID=3438749 RepID=UPI003F9256FB
MNPIDFISISTKAMKAYETFCQPVCKKYQLSQTSFDVLMFLANNPEYNTARDICEIRGIRTGIASVAVDLLVKNGYIHRQPDASDRRLTRLILTEKSEEIIQSGRLIQREFGAQLITGISDEEMTAYMKTAQKFRENILNMKQTRGDLL